MNTMPNTSVQAGRAERALGPAAHATHHHRSARPFCRRAALPTYRGVTARHLQRVREQHGPLRRTTTSAIRSAVLAEG
ncbi:hypothetical protein ACQPW1_47415 [Nocardia sp. CA-128927]|uniref:hypothetical protein n=1 Tax=Nocardia sp. CA-128927 TaxID=3239975 RepID=UPI003D9581D5